MFLVVGVELYYSWLVNLDVTVLRLLKVPNRLPDNWYLSFSNINIHYVYAS